MKSVFVTYVDNGVIKKGRLSEEKLAQLQSSQSISEVQTYANERLMEQTYGQLLCSGGNCDNRNFLMG
jgi:hypothetical protein